MDDNLFLILIFVYYFVIDCILSPVLPKWLTSISPTLFIRWNESYADLFCYSYIVLCTRINIGWLVPLILSSEYHEQKYIYWFIMLMYLQCRYTYAFRTTNSNYIIMLWLLEFGFIFYYIANFIQCNFTVSVTITNVINIIGVLIRVMYVDLHNIQKEEQRQVHYLLVREEESVLRFYLNSLPMWKWINYLVTCIIFFVSVFVVLHVTYIVSTPLSGWISVYCIISVMSVFLVGRECKRVWIQPNRKKHYLVLVTISSLIVLFIVTNLIWLLLYVNEEYRFLLDTTQPRIGDYTLQERVYYSSLFLVYPVLITQMFSSVSCYMSPQLY